MTWVFAGTGAHGHEPILPPEVKHVPPGEDSASKELLPTYPSLQLLPVTGILIAA